VEELGLGAVTARLVMKLGKGRARKQEQE
jgi:hypothetical protein